ncbi:MAG: hypothetical protein Q9184_004883 [Pyrenodesmia sp. 2 TL-2023]
MDTSGEKEPSTEPKAPSLPPVPSLFTSWPPIHDELETETSESQDETVRECLPFLTGSVGSLHDYNGHGLPKLARDKHIHFLHGTLEMMPAAFVGFDASRPWIIYWALTALTLLGEDIQPYRERYIMSTGGFLRDGLLTCRLMLRQSETIIVFDAECQRRLRWWSRPDFPLRSFLRGRAQPGFGWWF